MGGMDHGCRQKQWRDQQQRVMILLSHLYHGQLGGQCGVCEVVVVLLERLWQLWSQSQTWRHFPSAAPLPHEPEVHGWLMPRGDIDCEDAELGNPPV
jgi:hypothetical protein